MVAYAIRHVGKTSATHMHDMYANTMSKAEVRL
jgi:hypothetical protein